MKVDLYPCEFDLSEDAQAHARAVLRRYAGRVFAGSHRRLAVYFAVGKDRADISTVLIEDAARCAEELRAIVAHWEARRPLAHTVYRRRLS